MSEKIQKFEDLIAWQKAPDLTRAIYEVARQFAFTKDFGLSRQIQRAAVSVMSNIAEGFERGDRGEFYQFLSTAKASCAEVRSQLYVALDVGYLDQAALDRSMEQAEEVARTLADCRLLSTNRGRKQGDESTYSVLVA